LHSLNKYESICGQGKVRILESMNVFAFLNYWDVVLSEKGSRHGS